MIVSEIKLYELLKARIGEKEADAFVEIEDLARMEGKLETKIAETKGEIIKWMFIFWIGQLASFIAIAKFFFHQ